MILLDTQVVLWTILDSERLGALARSRMESDGCYVSAISVVEFRIKQMKGKLNLPSDLPTHMQAQGFENLPFDSSHADSLARFPTLVGHDPFDRMLLAQARSEGLEFLTSDRVLLTLNEPWIIDATK